MIRFIRNWCENIIVAIIISIIIEMLIPEGNNKKYAKVVVGIYITFTIINPILSKSNEEFDIANIIKSNNTVEVSVDVNENIKDVFIKGIEENLKNEILENFGYTVNEIEIKVDLNYENIEKIKLKINEKTDTEISVVKPIEILKEEPLEKEEFLDIKKYISENYGINIENIEIYKRY